MNLCMGVEEKLALMGAMDLFKPFSDTTLRLLCEQCNEIYLNAGDYLFREGSLEDSMYLVLDGGLVVSKQNRQIAELGPGQYVGEMALIESKPRSATARATSELLLMELSRYEFDTFLAAEPKALRALIHTLADRVRDNLEQLSADIKQMSILAHDMRHCLTPLGLVESYLEDEIARLEGQGRAAEAGQAREQLTLVMRVSDEIGALINQSLGQVRKIKPGYRRNETDVIALLRETVEDLRHHPAARDRELSLMDGASSMVAWVNDLDLRRVLRNLIINGLEASPPGGSVSVQAVDLGDQLEISIVDSGPGVSDELRRYLFHTPVTTKDNGSGLGLIACREIIEDRHHGLLAGEPADQGGYRFHFTLPRRQVLSEPDGD